MQQAVRILLILHAADTAASSLTQHECGMCYGFTSAGEWLMPWYACGPVTTQVLLITPAALGGH